MNLPYPVIFMVRINQNALYVENIPDNIDNNFYSSQSHTASISARSKVHEYAK